MYDTITNMKRETELGNINAQMDCFGIGKYKLIICVKLYNLWGKRVQQHKLFKDLFL